MICNRNKGTETEMNQETEVKERIDYDMVPFLSFHNLVYLIRG